MNVRKSELPGMSFENLEKARRECERLGGRRMRNMIQGEIIKRQQAKAAWDEEVRNNQ